MVQTFDRALAFLQRFLVSVDNIGLLDSIRIFFICRSHNPIGRALGDVSVSIRKLDRRFFFRGAADKGVMSHFFTRGYRIRENSTDKVKFIIDAGANIGDETVRFRFFHPNAIIVGLEPAEDNFRLLQRNVQHDPHIIAFRKGLWSKECRLRVIPGPTNEAFRVVEVPNTEESYDVLGTTVHAIMRDFGVSEVDILKMDIEGAEYQVFSENSESWMSKVKVYIFECPDNDRRGTTFAIFKALSKLNYNCFVHGENFVLIRDDVPWTLESDLFFRE